MLSYQNQRNSDPYQLFKDWCLKNGFGDVINCKSENVNLRRLGEAINRYVPPKQGLRGTAGFTMRVRGGRA